ncbi:MAG: DNA/RNA endonuclease G, partial [Microbacterium sp.]
MTNPVLMRVVRRETHSPRTAMTVIVLVFIAAAAVYAGIEIVLRLSGAAPLLVTPGEALAWMATLPGSEPRAAIIAGAAAVAVIGLMLLWFAVAPGRRPKHALGVSGHAVVVDNGVIASAVAERVRRDLDLSKGRVVVGVGHRSAEVMVRPEPGQVVDRARVRSIAEAELDGYGASPRLK